MKKINYKSDFDFILRLKDCRGNEIGWPSFDWVAKLSTSNIANRYISSCIAGECVNCFNDNGQIHVVVDNHNLLPGSLNMEFVIEIPNSHYPDGHKRICVDAVLDCALSAGECSYSQETFTLDAEIPEVPASVEPSDPAEPDTPAIPVNYDDDGYAWIEKPKVVHVYGWHSNSQYTYVIDTPEPVAFAIFNGEPEIEMSLGEVLGYLIGLKNPNIETETEMGYEFANVYCPLKRFLKTIDYMSSYMTFDKVLDCVKFDFYKTLAPTVIGFTQTDLDLPQSSSFISKSIWDLMLSIGLSIPDLGEVDPPVELPIVGYVPRINLDELNELIESTKANLPSGQASVMSLNGNSRISSVSKISDKVRSLFGIGNRNSILTSLSSEETAVTDIKSETPAKGETPDVETPVSGTQNTGDTL